jgi:hypothetical protein
MSTPCRFRVSRAIGAMAALILAGCSSENPRVVTRVNQDAALTGDLIANPLGDKVITTWIDPRNSTMSTLFGNDVAVENSRGEYPAGSMLALVTWTQQEDPRWFGAKIPAKPQSVEFVVVGTEPAYSYRKYEGSPLKQVSTDAGTSPNDRAAYLLSQRAAVMP